MTSPLPTVVSWDPEDASSLACKEYVVNQISFNDHFPDPQKFPKLPPPLPPTAKPDEQPGAQAGAALLQS